MKNTFAFYVSGLRKCFAAYCEDELKKMGISKGLVYILLYIGKHTGCMSGEIAAALVLDNGHLTRCLDKMAQAELIQKRQSAEDKRKLQLSLTEKGEKAYDRCHTLFGEWDAEALGVLDDNERKTLMSLMEKVVQVESEKRKQR